MKDTTLAKTMSPGLKLLYVSTCKNKDKSFTLSTSSQINRHAGAAEKADADLIKYADSNTPCLFLLRAHLLSWRVRGSGLSFESDTGK